jgi:hypothetical protein
MVVSVRDEATCCSPRIDRHPGGEARGCPDPPGSGVPPNLTFMTVDS